MTPTIVIALRGDDQRVRATVEVLLFLEFGASIIDEAPSSPAIKTLSSGTKQEPTIAIVAERDADVIHVDLVDVTLPIDGNALIERIASLLAGQIRSTSCDCLL